MDVFLRFFSAFFTLDLPGRLQAIKEILRYPGRMDELSNGIAAASAVGRKLFTVLIDRPGLPISGDAVIITGRHQLLGKYLDPVPVQAPTGRYLRDHILLGVCGQRGSALDLCDDIQQYSRIVALDRPASLLRGPCWHVDLQIRTFFGGLHYLPAVVIIHMYVVAPAHQPEQVRRPYFLSDSKSEFMFHLLHEANILTCSLRPGNSLPLRMLQPFTVTIEEATFTIHPINAKTSQNFQVYLHIGDRRRRFHMVPGDFGGFRFSATDPAPEGYRHLELQLSEAIKQQYGPIQSTSPYAE